jgi:hypothetical protein
MSRITFLVIAFTVWTVARVHGIADIEDAITVNGRIEAVRTTHPNGTIFTSYILKTDRAIHVEGDATTGSCSTDERMEIQIFGDDVGPGIVGKSVTVTGSPFCEHTAWHIRPVVLQVRAISIH